MAALVGAWSFSEALGITMSPHTAVPRPQPAVEGHGRIGQWSSGEPGRAGRFFRYGVSADRSSGDVGGLLSEHVVEPVQALVVAGHRISGIWDLVGYLGKQGALMLATALTTLNETERAA